MVALRVVVCFALLAASAVAIDVQQCSGKSFENLSENVKLIPCKKNPCRLKRGTNPSVEITFTPDKDADDIKNDVFAEVYGLPLPFVGVDGMSVCEKLYLENGDKASCPLKAGTKYTYKDTFPVLSIYPQIPLKVHWALKDNSDTKLICFEVPARIV